MPIDEIQINRLFLSGVKLAQYVCALHHRHGLFKQKQNRRRKNDP